MEVFGHHDIAVNTEIEFPASFFQDSQENLLDSIIIEKRAPPVTTASDEVRTVGVVTALETGRHEQSLKKAVSVGR